MTTSIYARVHGDWLWQVFPARHGYDVYRINGLGVRTFVNTYRLAYFARRCARKGKAA